MMSIIRRFRHDRGGNFAILAGLGAVPLLFAAGAGIDGSRLLSAKKHLQAAVDGAALSVVKTSGFDPAKANVIAERMIRANYGDGFQAMKVTFTPGGAKVTAETVVPTTLTAVLGFKEFTAEVSGTVEYPQTKYEIVLVLDTTGSMAGQKLAEMKEAAAAMVEQLTATQALRDRVRFALVPFSTYVNVGPDKAKENWIDSGGKVALPGSVIPAGVSRLKIMETGFREPWYGCVETRIESGTETLSVDDTPPQPGKPRSLFVPMLSPDEPETKSYGRRLYPNSYVEDETLKGLGVTLENGLPRYGLVNALAGYLFFSNDTQPQGPNWGCNSRPIVALTNNPQTVKSEIKRLEAAGSTNIMEGMAWANRVLSPGEPFTEGEPVGEDVKKIVVLLTDGDNSITLLKNDKGSSYSSYGYIADGRWDKAYKKAKAKTCKNGDDDDDDDDDDDASSNADGNCSKNKSPAEAMAVTQAQVLTEMNEDTQQACSVAKTAGSEVYTIRLEVATTTSSDLLSRCASSATHYYDVKDADELPAIFDAIANRILKLKITS
ncbi:MAG: TadE/TadG family protein [Rhizobiaceae bacterium]|nr:TadE/TadG family protein [Rhizobiaceae bacterium]